MKNVLLIDFGSTYTKVTAVDAEQGTLLGTADSYTTIETDVGEGLEKALARLHEKTGPLEYSARYACSSAAGGLRMVTSGLVPELTAEAAYQASLGAGAKVIKVYSFQLTEDDVAEVLKINPDIFLLVGGTDGGNTECILHNARMLAEAEFDFPVIIAGNRTAARECERILSGHVCREKSRKNSRSTFSCSSSRKSLSSSLISFRFLNNRAGSAMFLSTSSKSAKSLSPHP